MYYWNVTFVHMQCVTTTQLITRKAAHNHYEKKLFMCIWITIGNLTDYVYYIRLVCTPTIKPLCNASRHLYTIPIYMQQS